MHTIWSESVHLKFLYEYVNYSNFVISPFLSFLVHPIFAVLVVRDIHVVLILSFKLVSFFYIYICCFTVEDMVRQPQLRQQFFIHIDICLSIFDKFSTYFETRCLF